MCWGCPYLHWRCGWEPAVVDVVQRMNQNVVLANGHEADQRLMERPREVNEVAVGH